MITDSHIDDTDVEEAGSDGSPPELMTAKHLERFLSLSPRKIWELTNVGEIPAIRIGRSVRYRRRQILEWVESQPTIR